MIDFFQQGNIYFNKTTSPNSVTCYEIMGANFIENTTEKNRYSLLKIYWKNMHYQNTILKMDRGNRQQSYSLTPPAFMLKSINLCAVLVGPKHKIN